MKSTTDSQLAEQAYKDYQQVTEQSMRKLDVAFMFNEYAHHYGWPLLLQGNASKKYAKVCVVFVSNISGNERQRVRRNSMKWLAKQVAEQWNIENVL